MPSPLFSEKKYINSIDYAIPDSLPFDAYIQHCQALIKERRTDLNNENAHHIIETNSPFELLPLASVKGVKYGALLIHGMLDSPFSMKDIGLSLQLKGVHCRAVLLPGHGTKPSDLIDISYQDWMQTVKYGIDSFKNEVDRLFLIGYSTGAALAAAHAMQNPEIAGLVLLSPAIRINTVVSLVVKWRSLKTRLGNNQTHWAHIDTETDYAKYRSIAFNVVSQVAQLTATLEKQKARQNLNTPIFMIMSREDETVSSQRAINFFCGLHHPNSRMLLYSGVECLHPDKRITTRLSYHPDLHINHFSHIAIPFAPENMHYGQRGDFLKSSRPGSDQYWYGAYNQIEVDFFNILHRLGIIRYKRSGLTFNPDFHYMADEVYGFLKTIVPKPL